MSNKNSRVIRLERSLYHIDRPVDETLYIVSNASKSLGSYWNTKGQLGMGLSLEEVKVLLPNIVAVEANNVEFAKRVSEWYSVMNIEVPDTGVELEVGLTYDNDKPIGKIEVMEGKEKKVVDNIPLELEDYLKYRFLATHPKVAVGEQEALNLAVKEFILIDESEKERAEELKLKESKKATADFFAIEDDVNRVNQILALLGYDYTTMTKVTKKKVLKEVVDSAPNKFNEAFSDELAEYKFFIEQCLSAEILSDVGGRILETEGSIELGANKREASLYLRDQANSDTYRKLQSMLKASKK